MIGKLIGTVVTASLMIGGLPTVGLTNQLSKEAGIHSSNDLVTKNEDVMNTEKIESSSSPDQSSEVSQSNSKLEETSSTALSESSTSSSSSESEQEPVKILESQEKADESQQMAELIEEKDTAVEVTTWDEFKAALKNSSITEISVANDLTANSAGPTVDHKVSVDFNGHQLNIQARYLTLDKTAEVTLKNLKFTGTSGGRISSGEGTLILSGTFASLDGNEAGIADMNAGSVIFDNVQMTYDRANRPTAAVTSKNFTITHQSNVLSNAIKFYLNDNAASDGAQIVIDDHSVVQTNSNKSNSNGQVWDLLRQSDFFVKGGSKLIAEGNISATGDHGGLFIINGDKTTVNVEGGSSFESHSKNSPAVLLQSPGGSFNVDDHSSIKLQSDGQGNNWGATLRFRLEGDMSFNIKNQSKIEIIKTAGSAPAIRMYGGNNKINVSGGSDFNVKNAGDGNPKDPGGDGRNQGIQYQAGAGNEFNIQDADSSVNIEADSGAAIDANTNAMNITAGKGTYFVTRGKTSTSNSGIFNAGNLNFQMDEVKYFDFRNNASNGGNIIESRSGSVFSSKKSDVSFWSKGSDLNGDPAHQWYQTDFSLKGTNLETLDTTNNEDMKANFGKLTNYSRMSANNQSAIIDELRVPTNADKYTYAHAKIPEAKGEGRDAYTDEVLLKVGLYDQNGQLINTLEGTSIGGGLSVYGDAEKKGLFKIETPNKDFLTAGQTLKVLEAWRGENNGTWIHQSDTSEIQTKDALVFDVTPPDPVSLSGNKTTISPGTTSIEGTGEIGSEVHVLLNGNETGISAVVGVDGKFQASLPTGLKKDDVIQILLKDHAGSANVIVPPATNDAVGNIEPSAELNYHDAVFKAGMKVLVTGSLDFISAPSSVDFGTHKVSNKEQLFTPTTNGDLVISDTRGNERGEWQLMVKESKALTAGAHDLSGLMQYVNKNGVVQITGDNKIVEDRKLDTDGSIDISKQWSKDYGLQIKVPVDKQVKGNYKGTLSWTLEDVPDNN